MSKQGELLSDIGIMVLANIMDKESNSCTSVRSPSLKVHTRRWEVEYPLIMVRSLGCYLMEGEIVESSPHIRSQTQLAHMDCSRESGTLELTRILELTRTFERIIS